MSRSTYEAISGSCFTMCPRNEIILRQRENLVHLLECKVNSNGDRTRFSDPQKMVKEFTRAAAGQTIESNSVRPLYVLQRTVNYLLSSVCSSSDVSWREIYGFVENRLRAIRQDITIQGFTGKDVVKILAPIARFYIYAHYRFCDYEDSDFDPYLNLMQLYETLLTILTIYQDNSYVFESHIVDWEFKLQTKSAIKDKSFREDEDGDVSMSSVKKQYSSILSSFEDMKLSDSQKAVFDDDINSDSHNADAKFNESSSSSFNNFVTFDGQRTNSNENNTEPHSPVSLNSKVYPLVASNKIQLKESACSNTSVESITRLDCDIEASSSDKGNSYVKTNDFDFVAENSHSSFPYTNIRNMEECLLNTKISTESDNAGIKANCSDILRYSVMEEMISLYLLVHLGNSEALSHALQLPTYLRRCELVSSVFEASLSWMLGNHFPLIRLSIRLPPILSCACHLHLNKVQRHALGILSVGHNSKALAYSIEDLENSLLFASSESLIKTCNYYGLSASTKGIIFLKTNFKWDAAVLKPEKANWVEKKFKEFSTSEILLP